MDLQKTTSYKIVLPFYIYAAACFLIACSLLLINTGVMHQHYFHPQTLALTHLMALGWGTMIILGAGYQLLPVLIEGKLDSSLLAGLSFAFAGSGIPLLVTGFYIFHAGWLLQSGAVLVNLGVIFYLVNVASSIYESKSKDVHAFFILAASIWLFATTFFGLLLVYNFSRSWLPRDSVAYLSLHAHLGLVGWFVLMILGVASRLIPMFLISKYTHPRRLWWVFGLVNGALVSYIFVSLADRTRMGNYIPLILAISAFFLFAGYISSAYRHRLRKQVDKPVRLSLLAVGLFLLPLLILVVIILSKDNRPNIALVYGFCCFFGWMTAIIFGMTFKTLPFIVWNKIYHDATGSKAPSPNELFSETLFRVMAMLYLPGFIFFAVGIVLLNDILLKSGAVLLLASAITYVANVMKTLLHDRKK